ncbi:hypothetical protein Droror1_Dr00005009 [Drosera rotundifolia]
MEASGAQFAVKDRRPDALGALRGLPDELICAILGFLSARDVARLACVSSVMYIFCNEEPLWMSLCLNNTDGLLQYKGSWKKTFIHLQEHIAEGDEDIGSKPLLFDGFSSLFLYRRLYRCYTRLEGFYADDGVVERRNELSLEQFQNEYDGKKPVLITGLADSWPAKKMWTVEQLLSKNGDTAFRISQRSPRKIKMKLKDYVSYINLQHDEDPLYIFDDKFGDAAPTLLKDYHVPHLFNEDFFDVLDRDKRPPFRWLIIGPERSGASWHVDPALTSAWNTLLCGRKRWALYPPGRVPFGVTVHVNEEDGDVNIDTPSSLQWWLDYYPLLPVEDKPIEFTQLPGETIFIPSGWWHCVLNLETTIAVTQNFVNSTNFEFVCLDMAPGYRHKGVCRAGLLALSHENVGVMHEKWCIDQDELNSRKLSPNGKRPRSDEVEDDMRPPKSSHCAAKCCKLWNCELPYEINFLSTFLDEERDHYTSLWSSGNCIGQREIREWLCKLWVEKKGIRDLIWKGACIALNAGKWLECVGKICEFHDLPSPTDDEKLPAGSGSNPVYLIGDSVIKICVEGGLESSLYGLGTELEFYNILQKVCTPLKDHVPHILASGIVYLVNGAYTVVSWDGGGLPEVIVNSGLVTGDSSDYRSHFGAWRRKLFEHRKACTPELQSTSSAVSTTMWPYIITRRCQGKMFAQIRESLSWKDAQILASFLGEQLSHLHRLPLPPFETALLSDLKPNMGWPTAPNTLGLVSNGSCFATEFQAFIRTLAIKKENVIERLTKWEVPIAKNLMETVKEYIPDDLKKFVLLCEGKTCTWIHSDIMDDNVYMEPSTDSASDSSCTDGRVGEGVVKSWKPSYILDFSDLTTGDPLLDLIPIHMDVFRGDVSLLKQLLSSYKLPFFKKEHEQKQATDSKFQRLSYHAMCYCILHDEDVLSAIFSIWEGLRSANSWEEVEEKVWGELNNYNGFS